MATQNQSQMLSVSLHDTFVSAAFPYSTLIYYFHDNQALNTNYIFPHHLKFNRSNLEHWRITLNNVNSMS